MKIRIHLDGTQTITGTPEECAEFMRLRDEQSEWPTDEEPSAPLSSFETTDIPTPPAPRVFKIPGRAVSLTEDEMRQVLHGSNAPGLTDRDFHAARVEAHRLRRTGQI